MSLDVWRNGRCYPMAIALAERLDCPLRVLWSKQRPDDHGWHPVHVMAEPAPDVLVDSGGVWRPEEIFDEFLPENCLARPHARALGRWESLPDRTALYHAFRTCSDDPGFVDSFGIPWIESVLSQASLMADEVVTRLASHPPETSRHEPARLLRSEAERLGLAGVGDAVDSDDLAALLCEREFDLLGAGCMAAVIAHPEDPFLAVRISDPTDGWVGYAVANSGSPFSPLPLAIGRFEGRWVCVTPRLDPVPESMAWVQDAIAVGVGDPSDKLFERACVAWPGLKGFVAQALGSGSDIRPENLMVSGGRLVINDPSFRMTEAQYEAAISWATEISPEP